MATKTPTASEPRADYAIQVEVGTAASATKSKKYVARVYREDPDGQKFDEHGIRIGRWESQPCGTDCVPNIFMAWCFPCVSAGQISHRMGESFMTMMAWWGFLYVMMGFAISRSAPSYMTMLSVCEFTLKRRGLDYSEIEGNAIVWGVITFVCWFVWLLTGMCLRSSVRARYQIPSACCGDCICMWCCSCCALTIMASHIKSYKAGTCDFGRSADALPGYDVEGPAKH